MVPENAEIHVSLSEADSEREPAPVAPGRADDANRLETQPAKDGAVEEPTDGLVSSDLEVAAEASASSDSSSPATQAGAAREAKAAPIKSTEDLFRFAYAQGGAKRLSIPGSSFQDMVRSLDADVAHPDPMRALVAELAGDDPMLAVPVRMLIAIDLGSPNHRLTQRLLDYIRIVLRRHDALRRTEVLRLLDNESRDLDAALGAVRESVRKLPDDTFKGGLAKGDQRRKLLVNATISLSLWFSMANKVDAVDFTDILDRHVWRDELAKSELKRPRAVLAESKTPEVLGWVAREFHRRLDAATRATDEAERFVERARAREAELEERAREQDQKLADQLAQQVRDAERFSSEVVRLEGEISALRTELANQQRQRSVDKTHHADDYKGLRARVLRSLDKQSELLRSGLHALRNERYSVADEYVERSMDAIDSERERLREQGA